VFYAGIAVRPPTMDIRGLAATSLWQPHAAHPLDSVLLHSRRLCQSGGYGFNRTQGPVLCVADSVGLGQLFQFVDLGRYEGLMTVCAIDGVQATGCLNEDLLVPRFLDSKLWVWPRDAFNW